MATLSSHVLDSVVGDHAKGIRIECYRIDDGTRIQIFDVVGNEQGRIVEEIEVGAISAESTNSPQSNSPQYELIFHTAAYWAAQPATPEARQIIDEVVVRFTIPAPDEKIHIPLVLSPHSYSLWWSA